MTALLSVVLFLGVFIWMGFRTKQVTASSQRWLLGLIVLLVALNLMVLNIFWDDPRAPLPPQWVEQPRD